MTKTTFNITNATLVMENILLAKMDIPKTSFHRRAIDYFIESNGSIHPYLFIKDRSDPNYIKKDKTEQIYLDDKRKALVEEVAKQNGCGITIVLFQALMTYCSVIAPIVLGEDNINRLFVK